MKTILTECLKCWPCFKILGISLFSLRYIFNELVSAKSCTACHRTSIKSRLICNLQNTCAGFSLPACLLLSESQVCLQRVSVTHAFLSNLVMIKAFPSEKHKELSSHLICSRINGNTNGLWLGYYVSAVFKDKKLIQFLDKINSPLRCQDWFKACKCPLLHFSPMYIFCSNKIDFVFIPGIVAHKVHRVRTRVPRRANEQTWVGETLRKLWGTFENQFPIISNLSVADKAFSQVSRKEQVTHSHAPLR